MDTNETASGRPDGSVLEPRQAGPIALRLLVGTQLRRWRVACGITRNDAGRAIRASDSKISRLELGRTSFKQRDVADLLSLYGVNDETERAHWLDLAKRTRAPGWWREYGDVLPSGFEHYVGLEEAASVIRRYESQFVPDLLQTPEYARAVLERDYDDVSDHQIERRISLQSRRQRLLHRAEPPKLWAIIDEAALRRQLGDTTMMRHQLEHLLRVSELPHVTIQVMLFRTGHAAAGPITILRFSERELPDVVYLEQLTGALCVEKQADIDQYTQVIGHLSILAEPPSSTSAILRTILEAI
jgi:hypothetical protein